jgi:hypothetical protein
VFGSGCSRKPDSSDIGSVRIAAINLLSYSDISKVEVTIAADLTGGAPAAITTPILVPLGKKATGNDWVSTVQGIPAGNVLYTGNAYDKTDPTKVIFTGSIKGAVTAGQTANVLLNLFEATPVVFSNNAPVVDALQVATTSATRGQTVAVSVVAHDPDATDTLTYAWTSSCATSSFAPSNAAASVWTAPASASTCVLTVTVTDNHGAATTATASVSVAVSNKGGAAITVTPDLAAVISAINVNVTNPTGDAASFVQNNIAHLSVAATDDGPTLAYAWTVTGCAGTYAGATLPNPTFVLSAASGTCTFTVVVTDDKGQTSSGSLVLPISAAPGTPGNPPVIEMYSSSSDSMAPGQAIYFYVQARLAAGNPLTFAWTATPASAPGFTQTDSPAANGLASSQYYYIAPADLGSAPAVITVTITDTVNHLTATRNWDLTKTSAVCANNAPTTTACDADGSACTADHCDGAGHCVVGTAVDCSANVPLCKAAGTCNPASGQCVYPNAANGSSCTDGLACTTGDICNGFGACNGAAVVCQAAQCQTAGTCQEPTGTCSASTPVSGGTCNDGNLCTTGDTCTAGVCSGSAVTCPAATDACHVAGTCQASTGTCSAPAVGNEGGACSDNSPCTTGDICVAGVCTGSPLCQAPLTCDASTTPATCVSAPVAACMQPTAAKDWAVLTVSVAAGGGSSPSVYTAGTLYASFDFGAGAKPEAGDSDVYVNGISPTTGLASWTIDLGDSSAQLGLGVAASTDKVGVIGNYLGSMNGATAFLPANAGATPVDFVLGLNPATGAPVWGKKVDLAGGDFASISSNPGLNAFFVCGAFAIGGAAAGAAGPADLIPTATPSGAGGKDVVVAKIDATNGAVLWAKMFGSTGDDVCTSVTSSDDGSSVYILGTYSNDTLSFGTSPALPAATSASQAHIFVAKLNGTDGTPLVAVGYGTTGRHTPKSIVADATGNLVIGGGFLTTINFATGVSIVSEGSTDAFVAKLDANLVPQWAKRFGGSAAAQSTYGLATDSTGHIFAVGLFAGSMNIGASGAAVATAGATDAFTMKLDAQGNLLCGATYGDSAGQEADAITVARFATGTAKDTAMFSGAYQGTINFGSVSITNLDASASHGFVTAINANSF